MFMSEQILYAASCRFVCVCVMCDALTHIGIVSVCSTRIRFKMRDETFGETGNILWHWFRMPFWLYFRFGIFTTSDKFMPTHQCCCIRLHARFLHASHTDEYRLNDECRMQLTYMRTLFHCLSLSLVKRRTFRLSNGKLLSSRIK